MKSGTWDRKRLKERFKRSGFDSFDEFEILEFLVGYAAPAKDANALTKALLQRFGSLKKVVNASKEELKEAGLSGKASSLIPLVREVMGVCLKERKARGKKIRGKKDTLEFVKSSFPDNGKERFLAVYLNAGNEILAGELLKEGALGNPVTYPRKAIEFALRHNARSVIFVHVIPGKNQALSTFDRQLTKLLDMAAQAVDLLIYDYLIICNSCHCSAREHGWNLTAAVKFRMAAED
ncbi:MAG: RadC family protein [Deltaproteobacteria bacterium]|nr:RadC family protein [Deltaproteobacteria bacterium]